MMIDPQQELFSAIKIHLESQGYDVYDGGLPPENTPYPFIYLADNQQIDDENKSAIFGTVNQTIHVWHNSPQKRGTVSAMLGAIKNTCREIHATKNFCWYVRGVNQRIMADNTTKTPLLHGLVDVEFYFYGKENSK